ncbi:MAG: PolC-type DNA polymerase III [Mycoplasma sp.]|nr:PolC-type DNA polymerase III [Mycoplasma sp.]
MDISIIKLGKEINWKPSESFNKAFIESVHQKNFVFYIKIKSNIVIPVSELKAFIDKMDQNFKYDSFITIETDFFHIDRKKVFDYLKYILIDKLNQKYLCKLINENHIEYTNDQEMKIKFIHGQEWDEFNKLLEKVLTHFNNYGINLKKISLVRYEENKNELEEAKIEHKKNIRNNKEKYKAEDKNDKETNTTKTKYRRNKYAELKISEFKTTYEKKVEFLAKIFKTALTVTKSGYYIFSFHLTDLTDAIIAKRITKSEKEIEVYKNFKENDWVEVRGNLETDNYSNELGVMISIMTKSKPMFEEREDTAHDFEKRVELSLRTKFSSMDGISDVSEYINVARKWGHEGIAITDYENVQAFPNAYNLTRNDKKFKVIYGVTVNVLDKDVKLIQNANDSNLNDNEYIVFDLETTGLYANIEDIIEFGAIRYKNKKIVEEKQFFIKPNKSISSEITKITNITNEMVENSVNQEDGLKQIMDWIGTTTTLVAHNATFDISFLNSKLEQFGFPLIKNPIIDTLQLARALYPKFRTFRLERVSKKLGILYDSSVAHRADYDAEVLTKVFIKMLSDLKENKIFTLNYLYKLTTPDLYKKQFANTVSIIAKNQDGIKRLFEIVSKSHIDNFYKRPIVFFDELLKNNENILIGSSSLDSRLINAIFTKTKKEIDEEFKKYDYIEVQPMSSFLHLFKRKTMTMDDYKNYIFQVLELAKKHNKIVVATSDARYVNEESKIYHEVIINSKGLGGSLHPLFRRGELNPVYPDQFFLTTQEMMQAFSFIQDEEVIKKIVVSNTQKILNQIERTKIIKDDLYKPKIHGVDKKLTDYVMNNARSIYGDDIHPLIQKRIDRELDAIIKYGYSVIYWIAHDLVLKSLNDGYLVGSRGSVGSSIVATLLDITEVNPLPAHYVCPNCKYTLFPEDAANISGYDLPKKECPECNSELNREGHNVPFEVFLGFKADKVPDIDLNFSGDYQPIIHNEVKKIFGNHHAFRAGTISTVAEKTAFGYVKSWAESKEMNISKAWIEFLAKGITGIKRTTGQHPGGIIVVPKEFSINDFTPINFPANDTESAWMTTHFDFHSIHDNLLKLDLLGHDDPTAIKMLVDFTNVDLNDIPNIDDDVISLFSSTKVLGIKAEDINGETIGVMGIPEFGTSFVRRMLKSVKVKSFSDLVSISGLSHGTDVWTNNAEILVKEQKKKLSEIISCRDDIMNYLIDNKIENSLAFKIMENVRKGRGLTNEWVDILRKNKIPQWYIDSCQKIKYMFPKAHAIAYVKMAWRIAWFKINHPLAYYATYFSTRADVSDIETINKGKEAVLEKLVFLQKNKNKRGLDKLSNKEIALIPILELCLEAFARKIKISNIDLHKSLAKKWIIDHENKQLIPPFIAIDGLGDAVAMNIENERKLGEFNSIEDFQKRTRINKTLLEKMKELKILKNLNEKNQISLF